ncbi:MAG: hypothetical protein R2702_09715 [Acidimicrobiales bacterium]
MGLRLERRVDRPRWLTVAVPLASVAVALLVGGVVIALSGNDALDTYARILERGFTSRGAFTATLTAATPCCSPAWPPRRRSAWACSTSAARAS